MARKNKNFNLKASLITFGVVGLGLIGLLGVGAVPGIIIAALAGGVGGVMFSPLDTTTHNNRDRELQQARQALEIPLTGDPLADPMITGGQALTEQIRKNLSVLDTEETLISSVSDVYERSMAILRCVSEAPEKAPRIRKFINYYLPTATKLLNNYCVMKQRGVSGEELQKALTSAADGYSMIRTVCEKQLDMLHSENLMDMDTDLDVLETMLVRDGYSEPIQDAIAGEAERRTAITAAEEQLRQGGVPVIQFPPDEELPFSADSNTNQLDQH